MKNAIESLTPDAIEDIDKTVESIKNSDSFHQAAENALSFQIKLAELGGNAMPKPYHRHIQSPLPSHVDPLLQNIRDQHPLRTHTAILEAGKSPGLRQASGTGLKPSPTTP